MLAPSQCESIPWRSLLMTGECRGASIPQAPTSRRVGQQPRRLRRQRPCESRSLGLGAPAPTARHVVPQDRTVAPIAANVASLELRRLVHEVERCLLGSVPAIPPVGAARVERSKTKTPKTRLLIRRD